MHARLLAKTRSVTKIPQIVNTIRTEVRKDILARWKTKHSLQEVPNCRNCNRQAGGIGAWLSHTDQLRTRPQKSGLLPFTRGGRFSRRLCSILMWTQSTFSRDKRFGSELVRDIVFCGRREHVNCRCGAAKFMKHRRFADPFSKDPSALRVSIIKTIAYFEDLLHEPGIMEIFGTPRKARSFGESGHWAVIRHKSSIFSKVAH
jgi:hypothetical protein